MKRNDRSYYYHQADPSLYNILKDLAKENRSNPSNAEQFLWHYLKDKELGHFRRQYIIGDYIVDFVCLASNLIIEIDGGYHDTEEQKDLDEYRTKWLESKGFRVIRFRNEEVIASIENVLLKIKENITIKA